MKTNLEFTRPSLRIMISRGLIAKASRSILIVLALSSMFGAVAQTPEPDKAALDAEATNELNTGVSLGGKGDPESFKSAILHLTNAVSLATRSGNQTLQANALFMRSVCRISLGNWYEAAVDSGKALDLYTTLNDPTGQFLASAILSVVYLKDRNDEKALPFMIRAWEQIKDGTYEKLDKGVIQTIGRAYFTVIGNGFARMGDRKRALDFLWKSYELTKEGPDVDAIDALLKYGQAQVTLETPKLAIPFLEIALNRSRYAKLRGKEAEVSLALGELYLLQLDDEATAHPYLTEALKISEEQNIPNVMYGALMRLGDATVLRVDVGKAFDYFKRANEVAIRANAPASDRAVTLYKVSEVQRVLGDIKEADSNEQAAFDLAKNGVHRTLEAQIIATRTFRKVEEDANDPNMTAEQANEKAFQVVQQLQHAIEIIKDEPGGRVIALQWLDSIGIISAKAGKFPVALDILGKVLDAVRARGNRSLEAMVLSDRGLAKYLSGDYRSAIEDLNQSITAFRLIGLKGREARSMEFLMLCWAKLNNRPLAIFFGKNAINLYQEIRQSTVGFSLEQQKALTRPYETAYRTLANLLIEQGRIAEAEKVLTMLKEQELIEYVRRDDSVVKQLLETMSVSDDERAAMLRYAELAEKITTIGKEFNDLEMERKQSPSGEFAKQQRYDELKQQLADASVAFQKFLDELKLKFGQNDTRVAQVDSSLKKTLERLKADRTAIVSTIVGEDKLNIIVTTSRTQRAHTVKVSAKEINQLVAKFRTALTSPQYDPRPTGQQLYDLIVKPIETDLAGIKAETVVWSLDGTLRYIPPAALWNKQDGYLAERFSNVVINLASRDTIMLPVQKGRDLSVLGVGVSKPVETFAALAAVPDELDCIVSDKVAGVLSAKPQCRTGVLSGRKLLDETFTLTNFENELGRYPIVHVASHFKLTPGDDKNSFLLLGGGTERRFTVEKLRSEPLTDVELIVLSACNTATPGGPGANGVEVEGFGSIAQKEGAKSVMATLWSVADRSTKDFMVEFYKLYGTEGRTKADAMRLAQLKLLNGKYSAADAEKHRADEFVQTTDASLPPFKTDPNAPFAHPYYWSPFILIGNWR